MKMYQNKEWLSQKLIELGNKTAIARICGVSSDTIDFWRKKFNLPNIDYSQYQTPGRKHFLNEHYFTNVDDEEKAYWLGYIMADGYIGYSTKQSTTPNEFAINCKSDDIGHLYKLNVSLNSDYPIKVIEKHDKRGFDSSIAELKIRSSILCSDLIRYQVIPRKTGKEIIPTNLDSTLHIYFIRGFFDGDGSIGKRPNSYYVSLGKTSKVLIEQIQSFFKNLNIEWKMYIDYRYSMPFYYLDTNRKQTVIDILHVLYNNANVYLNRKYNKALEVLNNISSTKE